MLDPENIYHKNYAEILDMKDKRYSPNTEGNEVWNPDPKIGSVEEGGDGSHSYQDLQMQYLSQGLARAGILFNQQLTISLTGHLELCAGDKLK